jgi:hypothetical protein
MRWVPALLRTPVRPDGDLATPSASEPREIDAVAHD